MKRFKIREMREPGIEKRFWGRITKTPTCWIWTGPTVNGYGYLYAAGEKMKAHRVSYLMHNGYLPSDLLVCHTCDNPLCVKPYHLFLGTNADNMADRDKKGRTNRPHGELNPRAKITKEQALEIINSKLSKREIMSKYNLSATSVWRIRSRKSWKELDDDNQMAFI